MNSYQTLSAYYDRFTDDVGYADWADFFERLFAREGIQPKLVLDLACGTGSLTRILAERGYEMIGADASPEMLMQAMQNTMDCEPRPLFLNQRMEALDLYGTVDACLCCLDSINYVTEPQTLQKAFHLFHRRPPVIMVTLQKQLLAGQTLQKGKVRNGILQLHGPTGIPRQHNRILRTHQSIPVPLQLFHVALPARKNIHGLFASQRQVQIPNRVNCHIFLLIFLSIQQTITSQRRF